MHVYRFRANIYGDVVCSLESCPICDACGQLVGAFTVESGDTIIGFISGQAHELALRITTGQGFWFTPTENADGKVASGMVTEYCRAADPGHRYALNSIWVDHASEELIS